MAAPAVWARPSLPDEISAEKPKAEEGAEAERRTLFSVSSDELDPTESLNRVSGEIDLGFAAPSQTYRSPGHYSPGPFSREKALESS